MRSNNILYFVYSIVSRETLSHSSPGLSLSAMAGYGPEGYGMIMFAMARHTAQPHRTLHPRTVRYCTSLELPAMHHTLSFCNAQLNAPHTRALV